MIFLPWAGWQTASYSMNNICIWRSGLCLQIELFHKVKFAGCHLLWESRPTQLFCPSLAFVKVISAVRPSNICRFECTLSLAIFSPEPILFLFKMKRANRSHSKESSWCPGFQSEDLFYPRSLPLLRGTLHKIGRFRNVPTVGTFVNKFNF